MFIKINNIPQNLDEFSNLLNTVRNKKLEEYNSTHDLEIEYLRVFLYFISEYESIKENYDFLSNFHSFIGSSISKFIDQDNKIEDDNIFYILSDFDIFLSSYVTKGVEFEELKDQIFSCLNDDVEIKDYFLK